MGLDDGIYIKVIMDLESGSGSGSGSERPHIFSYVIRAECQKQLLWFWVYPRKGHPVVRAEVIIVKIVLRVYGVVVLMNKKMSQSKR